MAATNLKREGLNNQKREVRVMVVPVTGAEVAGDGAIYATLPENSMVIQYAVSTTTAGAASSTIQINIAGANHGAAIATAATGTVAGTTAVKYATGGDVIVKAGGTAPGANFVGEVEICYIETDMVNGEYTRV